MRLLEINNQEEMIAILERASYEVQCRRNIINFMINDGMNNTENFNKYWEEYILYTKAYDKLKHDFQVNHVIPNAGENFQGRWEVDFNTREIKLYD